MGRLRQIVHFYVGSSKYSCSHHLINKGRRCTYFSAPTPPPPFHHAVLRLVKVFKATDVRGKERSPNKDLRSKLGIVPRDLAQEAALQRTVSIFATSLVVVSDFTFSVVQSTLYSEHLS